jgi:hypothetical protein
MILLASANNAASKSLQARLRQIKAARREAAQNYVVD